MKRQHLFLHDAEPADKTPGGGGDAPQEPTIVPEGRLSETEVDALKQKHPQGIYSLVVLRKDGKFAQAYFKKPTRADLNYSKTKRDQEAPDEQFLALASVTFVGGDEAVLKDEQAMISVCAYMEAMPIGATAFVLNH